MVNLKRYSLPQLILLMGVLYIFFIPSDPMLIKIIFKLIPMWLIIWFGVLQFPTNKSPIHWLLLSGLFCCMLGDGLLHWFIIGLSAFLIGHLFYTAGFLTRWTFSPIRFLTILPISLFAILIGNQLITGLIHEGNKLFILPVLLYIIIISLMAWAAIMTGNRWAAYGSLLFVLSDSILSWNMFIHPISFSGPLIMITYYSAQFLIARSLQTI
ncbi:lysoplasmalogenase [Heyndrickxia oleronia]|uniref:Lysoplasmalogenase n=2 Tax=Heyndrickxia oleronia TaxID=38875 RepID=A0AAW6SWD6_9BACI|nr:lysoplasmalogenase [Heyndrickxia oleronia]